MDATKINEVHIQQTRRAVNGHQAVYRDKAQALSLSEKEKKGNFWGDLLQPHDTFCRINLCQVVFSS